MKIGVLTYHRVINIGAILQAYCVCEFFKSLGHEVFLIDLRNKKTEWKEIRKLFNIRKLRINKYQLNNFRSVRKFLKQNFSTTRVIYDGNTPKFAKYLSKYKFDLVSVGSDTIWEFRTNGYTTNTVNEFFLPNYKGKKISFSASMDPVNKLIHNYYQLMKKRSEALKNFDYINIRDTPTDDAFAEFGLATNFTADPTIIMKNHEIFNVKPSNQNKDVGLQLNPQINNFITKHYKGSVINIHSNKPLIDMKHFPSDLSVKEYLIRLGNLKALLTNRFHGTILTLLVSKCETPVIAFEDPNKWHNNHSKIRDLFQKLGVREFVTNDPQKLINLLEKIINGDLVWPSQKVRDNLSKLSNSSRSILKKQLESLK